MWLRERRLFVALVVGATVLLAGVVAFVVLRAPEMPAARTPQRAQPAPSKVAPSVTPHAEHSSPAAHPPGLRFDVAKIPAGQRGASNARVFRTGEQPHQDPDGIGAFRTVCEYSHMRADDPIVRPGQAGASHLHTFWGNTRANASSTTESLRSSGNGTCRGGTANRSAYWTPSVIDTRTGTPLAPFEIHVYYKSGYAGIAPQDIQAFPAGLRMVIGDARATRPQERDGVGWSCLEGGQRSASIPDCGAGGVVSMDLDFPQCSDGRADSADHRSHLAYPVNGRCPSSHSRPIPAISYHLRYRAPQSTKAWRLASDMYPVSKPGGYSVHGDWWGAWDPAIQRAWLDNCTRRAGVSCGSHLLGDGRAIG